MVVVGRARASDGTGAVAVGAHCMNRGAVGATSEPSVRLIGTGVNPDATAVR